MHLVDFLLDLLDKVVTRVATAKEKVESLLVARFVGRDVLEVGGIAIDEVARFSQRALLDGAVDEGLRSGRPGARFLREILRVGDEVVVDGLLVRVEALCDSHQGCKCKTKYSFHMNF